MTDLSAVALPDSPALPAEIEAALQRYDDETHSFWVGDGTSGWKAQARESLRSVIAKHLLTAEEAEWLITEFPKHMVRVTASGNWASWCVCVKCENIHAKLRLLSGSSRGEE